MTAESETVETNVYHEWTDFLEAIRCDDIRFEEGAYAAVRYDSSYSPETQTLSGEVEGVSNSMGRPFYLDGKRIQGFHVEGEHRRTIGHVEAIEWEVADE